MGIFNKIFGSKKQISLSATTKQELRLEYQVMKNIFLEKCLKYENTNEFKRIENGVYLDLNDEEDFNHRMTISYELESDETNNQYPLDDILDKYSLHVSDFLEAENEKGSNKFKLELGGDLKGITNAKEIIGKKVFNRDFIETDGQVRVKLVIE
ncbi:hypothetical protein LNJ05_12295 [Tenacibaculum finnmarkense genomovar ulcerans]|uniref:hypothetical protein n=1 Tax=Tenacibaculum finnmarkense TaxID=2781243 RepID=UPI001E29F755|nr:hypothetical protein [Tenacibaculum finnmarkense]MCD8433542.1 hypothetical protein [Tenacibaculum finnmarkense genomovar ulcerans]